MRILQFTMLSLLAVSSFLLSGCSATISLDSARQPRPGVNFNDPVLNSRTILLFGEIDQQASEDTIRKLLYLDGKGHEPIDLFLNSPGGEVRDGWAIVQVMGRIHSPVNTYALSECDSCGAMLLAAGTGKRTAFHGAVIVIHGLTPHGRPPAELVNDWQTSYTEFWRKRSRLPQEWLPLPFEVLHILTAEQALQYGVVDEVVGK